MPNNSLNISEPNTFSNWLQGELQEDSSITPHLNLIPDNLNGIKGIYFWFMKTTGYDIINASALNDVQEKQINGDNYHLVYIGTAGMGKNGGSDLLERLKWHIYDKHTQPAVCSGALSTLRQGLGALLSDDLILPDTQEKVNQFMKSFMRVYWVSYKGNENDIDVNEFALIQNLRPLLNIRNNPNALTNATANPTRNYKLRRVSVIATSRTRLNCLKESEAKMNKTTPTSEFNSRYKEQIISSNEKCIEFSVHKNQSIAEVVRGIPGLPEGKVSIAMYNAADLTQQIFPSWKKTGSGKQNIYTYFSNTGGSAKRYQLIQNYMVQKNIDEIIVKVCEVSQAPLEKSLPSSNLTINELDRLMNDVVGGTASANQVETSLKDIPPDSTEIIKKITTRYMTLKSKNHPIHIITCSARKNPGGNQPSALVNLSFNETLFSCRETLLNMYLAAGNPPLNWDECLPAVNRYNGIIYTPAVRGLMMANPGKILIVSALFGIIKPMDLIPNYDLSMDSILLGIRVNDFWRDAYNNCEKCVLNKVLNQINVKKTNDTFVHLLSKSYQKAFCGFTNLGPPALNYIPNLVLPPNPAGIIFDNYGHWKVGYLTAHI
ncbi:MAG: hypothetical protein BroJett042_04110 [Bacteroidota bacterium]|nr:MAG: hypothetical protein BroJett042_04110 [Bacteroidota bacterium]